jgi:hypothetical protein
MVRFWSRILGVGLVVALALGVSAVALSTISVKGGGPAAAPTIRVNKLFITPQCVTAKPGARSVTVLLRNVQPYTWWRFALVPLDARGGVIGPDWGHHRSGSLGRIFFRHSAPQYGAAAGPYNVSALYMFGNHAVAFDARLKVAVGACRNAK